MYLFSIRYKNAAMLQFSATYLQTGISAYADTEKVWILNEKNKSIWKSNEYLKKQMKIDWDISERI